MRKFLQDVYKKHALAFKIIVKDNFSDIKKTITELTAYHAVSINRKMENNTVLSST